MLKNFVVNMMRRWSPDTFVSRKLNQAADSSECVYSAEEMKGTVAICEHDGSGWVKKRLRPGFVASDQRELTLVARMMGTDSVVGSWADAANRYEHDLLHEAHMQQLFRDCWTGDPLVCVPRLEEDICTSLELVHQYYPWPRFADVIDQTDAVRTVARFFFDSIARFGLLHGDISDTNILVCPDDPRRICVLDFGLSFDITSEAERRALLEVKENSSQSRSLLGRWFAPSAEWTPRVWYEELRPLALLGDPGTRKHGCFVRSLVALTRMACLANLGTVNKMVFLV